MSKIELELQTDETGSLRVRVPGPAAAYRVRLTLEWDEAQASAAERRRQLFDEIRANGSPVARQVLDTLGEEGVRNPEGLLLVGSVPDSDVERPPQLPLETREGF